MAGRRRWLNVRQASRDVGLTLSPRLSAHIVLHCCCPSAEDARALCYSRTRVAVASVMSSTCHSLLLRPLVPPVMNCRAGEPWHVHHQHRSDYQRPPRRKVTVGAWPICQISLQDSLITKIDTGKGSLVTLYAGMSAAWFVFQLNVTCGCE